MDKKQKKTHIAKAREALRQWTVKYSGDCNIQNGENGKDYPCGTCFNALLGDLLNNEETNEYKKHNKPIDRINEVWRFILEMRDKKY